MFEVAMDANVQGDFCPFAVGIKSESRGGDKKTKGTGVLLIIAVVSTCDGDVPPPGACGERLVSPGGERLASPGGAYGGGTGKLKVWSGAGGMECEAVQIFASS